MKLRRVSFAVLLCSPSTVLHLQVPRVTCHLCCLDAVVCRVFLCVYSFVCDTWFGRIRLLHSAFERESISPLGDVSAVRVLSD